MWDFELLGCCFFSPLHYFSNLQCKTNQAEFFTLNIGCSRVSAVALTTEEQCIVKNKWHPVLSSEALTHPTQWIFSDRVCTRLEKVSSVFLSFPLILHVWRTFRPKQAKKKKKVNKATTLLACEHVTSKYDKIILVELDAESNYRGKNSC